GMPIVLPDTTYASSPRRWPRNSRPSAASDVPIMPAWGTNVAVRAEAGSVSVTASNSPMDESLARSHRGWIVLYPMFICALGDHRGLGGVAHGGPAAHQNLAVAPTAVTRHDVGQQPGLAHVQAARGFWVGVVTGPRRVGRVLRDGRDREPGVGGGELPQRREV